jgi:hypothetical protein
MNCRGYEQDSKNFKEKECYNCLTKETPLWRRSKKGFNLCNACGLYFRNHGEHRPVANTGNNQNHTSAEHKKPTIAFLEKLAVAALAEMRSKVKIGSSNNDIRRELSPKKNCLERYERTELKALKPSNSSFRSGVSFDEINREDSRLFSGTRRDGISNSINQVKSSFNGRSSTSSDHSSPVFSKTVKRPFVADSLSQYENRKETRRNDFQLTMRKGRPSLNDYKLMEEHNSDDLQDIVNRLASFSKK